MRQIGYAMQFRGSAGPQEGKENELWAKTGSTTNGLSTSLDAGGPQVSMEDASEQRASFTSNVQMLEDGAFTEDGTIDFGEAGTLDFSTIGTGRMGPSAIDGLTHGGISWRVDGGTGPLEVQAGSSPPTLPSRGRAKSPTTSGASSTSRTDARADGTADGVRRREPPQPPAERRCYVGSLARGRGWARGPDGPPPPPPGVHARQYVFPGGGVEPCDRWVRPATELRPGVAARLARSASPARARSLAAAAVRETFEETGLALGLQAPAANGRPPARMAGLSRDRPGTGARPLRLHLPRGHPSGAAAGASMRGSSWPVPMTRRGRSTATGSCSISAG